MKTIIWNDLAVMDYHENIDYLLDKWSDKQAIAFINEVDALIFDLKQGIVEFKETGYQDIRQCVIRKQVTVYYKHNSSNEIELLRFWNNYKDKKQLKL